MSVEFTPYDGERLELGTIILEYWCEPCDLPAHKTSCPHCAGTAISIVITQRHPEEND